jgi:heme-degrading monooxygenase HmoA
MASVVRRIRVGLPGFVSRTELQARARHARVRAGMTKWLRLAEEQRDWIKIDSFKHALKAYGGPLSDEELIRYHGGE